MRRPVRFLTAGLLALAGCAAGFGTARADADLTGSWNLVAIDGRKTAERVPLRIDATRLSWGIECRRSRLDYSVKGSRMTVRAAPTLPNDPPPCLVEASTDEKNLDAFLPIANSIEPGPADGLRIYGGGHVLLFERTP